MKGKTRSRRLHGWQTLQVFAFANGSLPIFMPSVYDILYILLLVPAPDGKSSCRPQSNQCPNQLKEIEGDLLLMGRQNQ